MEKYYIMVNNQQEGPFTKEEIISKGFSDTSYIYNKSLGGWKKISEVSYFTSFNINENTKDSKASARRHPVQNKSKSSESNLEVKDNSSDLKVLPNINLKGIFSLFKASSFSKAHSELKNNNLLPQAMLLKQAKRNGYQVNSRHQRDLEVTMLKSQNVGILAALTSVGRFNQAKEICLNNDLEKGAEFFDFYIDLYGYYIKNHNNL
jgi:hypothetical protein